MMTRKSNPFPWRVQDTDSPGKPIHWSSHESTWDSEPASKSFQTGTAQDCPRRHGRVLASVEQRDDPSLRGRPVVVAWRVHRSVVLRSATRPRIRRALGDAGRARRAALSAIFVPPDFRATGPHQAGTRDLRAHTDLIEPLSLDEAYLDVTAPLPVSPPPPAWRKPSARRSATRRSSPHRPVSPQQVSRQDRLGLAQARWPVCDPPEEIEAFSRRCR